MKEILAEIQDGRYANAWMKENETGRKWFEGVRAKEQDQLIEKVGAELRNLMPFLKPVNIKQ